MKGKGLIFVNDVDKCYRLKLFLQQFYISAAVLNAEVPLNSRLHILEEYNRGVFDYLIATDASVDKGEVDELTDDEGERMSIETDEDLEKEENKKLEDDDDDDDDGEEDSDGMKEEDEGEENRLIACEVVKKRSVCVAEGDPREKDAKTVRRV